MTTAEWTVLGGGIVFVLLLAAWHLGGILLIHMIACAQRRHSALAVLYTFWGLLVLHLSEVALGALAFWVMLAFPDLGTLDKGYGSTPGGLLYLSGINFSTLGYTQMVAGGPLRLFIMLQSLSGFMLITWSATLVYSVWGTRYRDAE